MYGDEGDGGFATAAKLRRPAGLAVGTDGSLYNGDRDANRVRRVGPTGRIKPCARGGNGFQDGVPATQAYLLRPSRVVSGPDGRVYISDEDTHRVLKVEDGLILRVAGPPLVAPLQLGGTPLPGLPSCKGENGGALEAGFDWPNGLAFDADGTLWVADYGAATGCDTVRRIAPATLHAKVNIGEVVVPSEDGSELYVFSDLGRHLRTDDAATGQTKLSFEYGTWQTASDRVDTLLHKITDTRGSQSVNGLVTQIVRAVGGAPLQIVPPFAAPTTLVVTDGWLTKFVAPGALFEYSFEYDNPFSGLLKQLTDPKNGTHTFSFDGAGRLLADRDPKTATGSPFRDLVRTKNGSVKSVAVTSAEGLVTQYSTQKLANDARIQSVKHADGTTVSAKFDAAGTRTVILADGSTRVSKLVPDPRFGLAAPTAEETLSLGGKDLIVEVAREATNLTDPLTFATLKETRTVKADAVDVGLKSTFTVDRGLNEFRWTSPANRKVKATLDSLGRVASLAPDDASPEVAPTTFDYDISGRLTRVKQGLRQSRFEYYQDTGFLQFLRHGTPSNESLFVTTYFRDLVGRPERVAVNGAGEWRFGFDKLESAVDLVGTPVSPGVFRDHSLPHDTVGLLEQYNPPDVTGVSPDEVTNEYDRDRRLTKATWPGGKLATLTYNPTTGLLTAIAGTSFTTQIGYDSVARPNSVTRGGITTGFGYDGFGKLPDRVSTTWATGGQKDVKLTYDGYLRVKSESVNGGATVTFEHDADGLVTEASSTNPSFTLDLSNRSGQSGRLKKVKLGSLETEYGYDATYGDLNNLTTTYSGSNRYGLTLTYDDLGRVATKTDATQGNPTPTTYSYDAAGRLRSASGKLQVAPTWDYDLNGNRTTLSGSTVGTYDEQDRLKTWSVATPSVSYEYYPAGGRKQRTQGPAGQVTTYDYDDTGNLISVTLPNQNKIEYQLDGLGRRVTRKKIVGGQTVSEERYLWAEGNRLLATLDGGGNLTAQFVYASGAHVPDLMLVFGAGGSAASVYRILTDQVGSVRAVVRSDGVVTQRISYDAWGKPTASAGNPNVRGPFGFAGGLWDDDTGLVHFGARDYDPEVGRWITKDPSLFDGGMNLYAYAFSDPVNLVDPSGTIALPPQVYMAAGGFIIGFSVNAVMQAVVQSGNGQKTNINWTNAVKSGLVGAAQGALGASGFAATSWSAAMLGSVAGMANYAATTPTCQWNTSDYAAAGLWGAVGGWVGGPLPQTGPSGGMIANLSPMMVPAAFKQNPRFLAGLTVPNMVGGVLSGLPTPPPNQ
ncbi:MAG: hypothetical protein IPI67_30255 [Myxococcales bacterium]|nr:hypothetical protein [Myxococcales bacterium]